MELIEDVALNVHRSKRVSELAKEHKCSRSAIYIIIYKLRKDGVKIPRAHGSKISRAVDGLKQSNPEIF